MQIDKEKAVEDKKDLEDIIDKGSADIKIGFHTIKSNITIEKTKPQENTETAEIDHKAVLEATKNKEDLLVEEALKRFSLDFFKEFSLADEKMMQTSLEE